MSSLLKISKNQNAKFYQAHLMLAKWTDRAGQTHSQAIVQRYREAIKLYPRSVLYTIFGGNCSNKGTQVGESPLLPWEALQQNP